MRQKAVVLLSGGLDSATVLAWAVKRNFAVYALSFDYGQRHRIELTAAAELAAAFQVQKHVTLTLDLRQFGGSALTDQIPVPKDRNLNESPAGAQSIPVTYVPARNAVFLSCALAWAEVLNCFHICIGVNAVDYSGYPDCRPEFIAAFEQTANLATKAGVQNLGKFSIHTPLISLTKVEIIRLGLSLGVDYSKTVSCYDPVPGAGACGHCDACQLRLAAFNSLGIADPTHYARNPAGNSTMAEP